MIAIFPCLLLASDPTPANSGTGSSTLPPSEPGIVQDDASGRVTLTSGSLELIVETKAGLNARSLRDLKHHAVFADRDYCWPGGAFPTLKGRPKTVRRDDGTRSVSFQGQLNALEVEQVFTAHAGEPGVIIETIVISNPSKDPADTATFKCGFAKAVRQGENWTSDAGIRFCPVPYRRETDGKMREFPLREVVEHGATFVGWGESPRQTPVWGAEGWVWSFPPSLPTGQGTNAFLVAKYEPNSMEWSLMEPVKSGPETLVRFGGAGQWKHGHPEGSARLQPGRSYRFGATRLQSVEGDWKQGYYAFRRWLQGKGCKVPRAYDPPVHWNELYDNQYFFKSGAVLGDTKVWYTPWFDAENKKLLREYYSLGLMLAEAAKAKEVGCQALYLDPGWDTGPSHQLWDSSRLGSMDSFVKRLKEDYGLKLSLWIGLGGVPPTYADPKACPPEAQIVDQSGKRTQVHCFASPAFLDTKTQRLLELCRHGAAFFMFDSTQFGSPCYDKTHGHSVPSTREEHARALIELAQRVKKQYPGVLIEVHDFITGPSSTHYVPTYYGYAQPNSFDCLWGHEFMWSSKNDLLSGRAVSLYYFNLAYDLPLYLHISLKEENENALLFWWYASTCRHLGLGGKPGPAAWEACKQAIQTYLPLKRFYAQGAFFGLDEMVHAHTLPDVRESVINAFNLDKEPAKKQLRFRLADIGLSPGATQVEGAPFRQEGNELCIDLTIPARGQRLLKVRMAPGSNP